MVLRLNSGRATVLATPLNDGRSPSTPFSPPGWTDKVERALKSGMADLTDPAFLLPMVAAQGVFGLSRLGLFKIIPQGVSKGAAVAAANGGAFALEGLAFVGSARGLRHAMGREGVGTSFARELGQTYLTLGLLKTLGGLTQSGLQLRYQKTPLPSLSRADRLILKSTPQAAQFAGVYLSHSLAPMLGLAEYMDPAERAFQSAVTLLHFGAAGHVLGKVPGFNQFNQRIRRETDRTLREGWRKVSMGNNGLPLGSKPALSGATGRTGPLGRNFNPLDFTQVMMAAASPQGSSELSTSPGNAPKLTRGNLGIRLPDRGPSIGPLPTIESAPAVRSGREGVRRAQALGLDQNALAFLQMAGTELLEFPKLRQAFFEHIQKIVYFTDALQEGLDPILRNIPERGELAGLNQSRADFDEALARLAPESGKNLAEALLFLESTKDLRTEESYRRLTEARLVDLGLEPMARQALPRNAHAFTGTEINGLLNHPLLKDLPETQKLRDAYQTYDEALEDFRPTVKKITEEINQINQELKATTNAQEQFELEAKKEAASGKIAAPYWRMVAKLNNAMETFLKEPVRANILHVGIAREAHVRRGIQDAHPDVLADYLRKNLGRLTEQARVAAQSYLKVHGYHRVFAAPGIKTLLQGIALFQPLNLPALTRGALDRATLGLIREIPSDFWGWKGGDPAEVREARAAGERFFRKQKEVTQNLRESFRGLDELNDQFWSHHDRQAQNLFAADVRFQMEQAQTYIQAASEIIPKEIFARHFAQRYEDGLKATREAIEFYEKLVESGSHARRINRSLEVAAERCKKKLTDLAREVLKTAHSHGADHLPDPQFRSLSALMMPYVEKINSSWNTRAGENLSIVLGHALPTVGQSLRLIKRIWMGESSAQIDGILLQYNRSRHLAEGSRWVVDPDTTRLVASEPIVLDGKHNSWDDFLRGGTPNARAAQLQNGKQNHTHRDCPRIGAKAGLGKKVPVAGKAIDLLTVPISDSAIEYDGAVTHMGRAMAFGDMPAGRLGPRSSAVYSELTMPVSSLVGPYVWDPFPAQSTILAPPLGGRSFTIADRAMALTGRAQNLLLTTTLNSYRLWPKPDAPLPLRRGPLTTTTEFWPMMALTDVTDSLLRFQRPGKPTRANWLRTLWLLEAAKPEYQLPVPSVEAMFDPYRNPSNPQLERQIANMFGGAAGVYPSPETVRALAEERLNLQARIRDLRKAGQEIPESMARSQGTLSEALDRKTGQLLRTRLKVLEKKIGQELNGHPDIDEAEFLERGLGLIRGRLTTLDRIEKKIAGRRSLEPAERQFLERAVAYYRGESTPEGRDPLMDQLEFYFSHRDPARPVGFISHANPEAFRILGGLEKLIEVISNSSLPFQTEILPLLKSRRQGALRAISRQDRGMPLTPVQEVLLEDLAGALLQKPHEGPRDALVSALMNNHVNEDQLAKILKAEKIRKASRDLIEKLPGGGLGSIDPIAESAEDIGKVMLNGAGQVVMGPRSHWATAKYAGIFAAYASALGALGALDWLTGGKFDFYTMASPAIARQAQRMAGWRPLLSPQDVRVAEEIRIEAEGLGKGPPRPIALAANHASWTDITTLMAVFPKMRFAFKEELMKIPFLNLALFFGRHQKVSRPKNNTPEERERAFRQVKNSGEQMVKTGLSPTFFHSGTRSLTGVPGTPKDGIAHLAMPTNALILAASILGTRQIMGDAGPTLRDGMGTGRRIFVGFDRVDPGEIIDLEAVLEHRNSPKVMVKAGKEISGAIHEKITTRFLEQLDYLRTLAETGDVMAQAQLAEQMAALEKGMELIRSHHLSEAKAWAKDHKTDYDLVKKITEWWDRKAVAAE